MRRLTRAVVTVAAVAGAMTAAGGAVAAAAPAATAPGTVTTQAMDWFYGTGYGSNEFSAISSAKWQAENRAWAAGYNPRIDCWVSRQYAYKISDYNYRGEVTLTCFK